MNPDPQVTPKNTNATIKWNLDARDRSGRRIEATFADSEGVYFLSTIAPTTRIEARKVSEETRAG